MRPAGHGGSAASMEMNIRYSHPFQSVLVYAVTFYAARFGRRYAICDN